MRIHPSASVDASAEIGKNCSIGPFCVIGPGVSIGEGCVLVARVSILGPARIGRRNIFHPTSAIGGPAQDQNPTTDNGRIEIGDENTFREATTVHAPKGPGGVTRIGSRNRFLFSSHVGHDSEVEDDVLLEGGCGLSGHSFVESAAYFEVHSGSHQFTSIGKRARIGSHTPVTEDVPPYMAIDGNHYRVVGLHREAIAHLPEPRVKALERAYQFLWESGLPIPDALAQLESDPTPEIEDLIAFFQRKRVGRFGRYRESLR